MVLVGLIFLLINQKVCGPHLYRLTVTTLHLLLTQNLTPFQDTREKGQINEWIRQSVSQSVLNHIQRPLVVLYKLKHQLIPLDHVSSNSGQERNPPGGKKPGADPLTLEVGHPDWLERQWNTLIYFFIYFFLTMHIDCFVSVCQAACLPWFTNTPSHHWLYLANCSSLHQVCPKICKLLSEQSYNSCKEPKPAFLPMSLKYLPLWFVIGRQILLRVHQKLPHWIHWLKG